MKPFFCLFITVVIFSFHTKAQSNVDLYEHVDSLIVHVLKYEYSEDTKSDNKDKDTKKAHVHRSPNSKHPEPLIILDGFPTKKEELKELPMFYIANIEILYAGAPSSSIYGSRARNGVIILTTKED